MKIVVAPDSFKGSLTAAEVSDAIEQGIREIFPEAEIVKIPMADGGDGTVQCLVNATGGEILKEKVTGPLGDKVLASYGILGDKKTAVIEMAEASGLTLVPENKRNPLITTTYGTGQLIKAALDRGCRKMIIGIGGSAPNDGGAGMVQALGVKLLDKDVIDVPGAGAAGGLGASLMAFLDAELRPGIDIVIEIVKLERAIKGADLVITGEGKIDSQTIYGKAPIGVARIAKKYNVPVVAIAAIIGDDADIVHQYGINTLIKISEPPMSLDEPKSKKTGLIKRSVKQFLERKEEAFHKL